MDITVHKFSNFKLINILQFYKMGMRVFMEARLKNSILKKLIVRQQCQVTQEPNYCYVKIKCSVYISD